MRLRIRLALLLVALGGFPLQNAVAHSTGAISLSSKQVSAGMTITVFGKEFARNSPVRLELRGILDKVAFGMVQTNARGIFQQVVTIPANSKAGQYNVVAVAPDGDVVAQATLLIAAAAVPQATDTGMQDMPGMQGMGGPRATAEMMNVQIPITPAGWAVIAAIVLTSATSGVWLLRSRRRSPLT